MHACVLGLLFWLFCLGMELCAPPPILSSSQIIQKNHRVQQLERTALKILYNVPQGNWLPILEEYQVGCVGEKEDNQSAGNASPNHFGASKAKGHPRLPL